MKIIENGVAFDYYDPIDLFNEIYKIIIATAEKKAKKKYDETLLLIYYAFNQDLFPGDEGLPEETFLELINKLKSIPYKADYVDFFIPEFQYENIYGVKSKPARLYNIKTHKG